MEGGADFLDRAGDAGDEEVAVGKLGVSREPCGGDVRVVFAGGDEQFVGERGDVHEGRSVTLARCEAGHKRRAWERVKRRGGRRWRGMSGGRERGRSGALSTAGGS